MTTPPYMRPLDALRVERSGIKRAEIILMAPTMVATWPDSQRNSVAEGESVRYHGNLSDCHGTWTFGGPCCCGKCMPALDDPGEVQFALYRFGDPGQKLSHVSCSSFTAVRALPATSDGLSL